MRLKSTLLILFTGLFGSNYLSAQNPNCSATFSATVSGMTATFSSRPDTLSTVHHWSFGDGTVSTLKDPVHTNNSAGSFNVVHYRAVSASNGMLCADTAYMQVNTSGNASCTFQPAFNFSTNVTTVQFMNITPGHLAGDSVLWTFGDGTMSRDWNAIHQYQQSGTYMFA